MVRDEYHVVMREAAAAAGSVPKTALKRLLTARHEF